MECEPIGPSYYMPFRHFMAKLVLVILDMCAKCCQSISKGFRVTDLNSRGDARVVANVDGRTYGRYERMENRIPTSHHA